MLLPKAKATKSKITKPKIVLRSATHKNTCHDEITNDRKIKGTIQESNGKEEATKNTSGK
jgi:hypothetical protein